jgi:hypothetical protein
MSDFRRRDAFLCILVGLGLGLVIGINLGPAMGRLQPVSPGPSGWGFLPFAPLFAFGGLFWLVIWALLIRGLFWGPWARGSWSGRGGRYYAGRLEDLPADFDDWHRRAHERRKETASADDPGHRG